MNEQVLIIDNNLENLKLMELFLKKEGMDVWKVADAETALLIVAKINPPIILIEMNLPKMNSITFSKILKNDNDTHRAVIIALLDGELENKPGFMLNEIFDGYITKPIDYEKIYSNIRSHLQNNSQRPQTNGSNN